jgi:hypothetical protein
MAAAAPPQNQVNIYLGQNAIGMTLDPAQVGEQIQSWIDQTVQQWVNQVPG